MIVRTLRLLAKNCIWFNLGFLGWLVPAFAEESTTAVGLIFYKSRFQHLNVIHFCQLHVLLAFMTFAFPSRTFLLVMSTKQNSRLPLTNCKLDVPFPPQWVRFYPQRRQKGKGLTYLLLWTNKEEEKRNGCAQLRLPRYFYRQFPARRRMNPWLTYLVVLPSSTPALSPTNF